MSKTFRQLTKTKGKRPDKDPHDRYNKELTPVRRELNKSQRKQEKLALARGGVELPVELPKRDKTRGCHTT